MKSENRKFLDGDSSQLSLHAAQVIDDFTRWMSNTLEPFTRRRYPLEFSAWQKELNLISSLIEGSNQIRIALIGSTGAGKSTLLNAILGQEVLPVGVMQPCTAFVTAVTRSTDDGYGLTIQFLTPNEWQRDIENYVAAFEPGENEEEADDTGEAKRLRDSARKRLEAVYGANLLQTNDPTTFLKMPLPGNVQEIFSSNSILVKEFQEAKEMLAHLRQLIRGDSPLWPLIKQVNLRGPYECLTSGIELVDLPGLNDPNAARAEITREFLRTSPIVWVVFSMVRGLTEDIQRILHEEKLLRTLIFSGTYKGLSLIGTKADDIDLNIADQLGLTEDCNLEELINAYRDQTVDEVHRQLIQMIRDLPSCWDERDTIERMMEMAGNVKIHTTSANAYMKLNRIGRLRKDYGLTKEEETGIPGIHQHLTEIGQEIGAEFNAEMALKRINQLSDEIAFFFRATGKDETPKVEQARSRFHQEKEKFSAKIREAQKLADSQLKQYRQQFLEKMDPLFESSIRGIERVTEGWRGIHWATLRAVVQGDGSFKSPTTGRFYDFNEALSEPLLSQLPVSWEKFFSDDMGHVAKEFEVRLIESSKHFCEKLRLIIELLFNPKDVEVEEQLGWFQDKITLLAQGGKNQIFSTVRERRSELAKKMPLVAKENMKSAYDDAKTQSGRGMKKRILEQLRPAAKEAGGPIYQTIQKDLLEGLNDLEVLIMGLFRQLTKTAEEQANMLANNANIDASTAGIDPEIVQMLNTIPRLPR